MPGAPARAQGRCAYCERIGALRRDGRLVMHWRPGRKHIPRNRCPGAGRAPAAGSVEPRVFRPASSSPLELLEQLELAVLRRAPPPVLIAHCAELAAALTRI